MSTSRNRKLCELSISAMDCWQARWGEERFRKELEVLWTSVRDLTDLRRSQPPRTISHWFAQLDHLRLAELAGVSKWLALSSPARVCHSFAPPHPLLFRCSWLGTADFDPLFSPRASDEVGGAACCFSRVFCRIGGLGAPLLKKIWREQRNSSGKGDAFTIRSRDAACVATAIQRRQTSYPSRARYSPFKRIFDRHLDACGADRGPWPRDRAE